MNRSRTLFAASALLASVALAPSSARAAGSPSYASLPEVSLPDMLHPKDAPEAIPASEQSKQIEVDRNAFGGDKTFLSVRGNEGRCVTLGSAPAGLAPSGNGAAHFRGKAGAVPLRLERFVSSDAGEASLEIADGWLDVATHGVRIEKTTQVKLARLAKGQADVAVYGFRSGGLLQVVIPALGNLSYVDEGGALGSTNCGHARLTLDTSQKGGVMIMAAGRAEFAKAAPQRPVKKANQPMEQAQIQQRFRGGDPMRTYQVSVSSSRTSRDKEPLLSVNVGWIEEAPPRGTVGFPSVEDEIPLHHREVEIDFADD